jgi:hypothetical protein
MRVEIEGRTPMADLVEVVHMRRAAPTAEG